MKLATHLFLAVLGLAAWLAFFIAGWPDYFRQYSDRTMAIVCVAQILPMVLIGYWLIGRRERGERLRFSIWFAVYTSVPYFLIDCVYLGVMRQLGASFLASYWFLTVSYFVPWLVFVPIGYQLARGGRERPIGSHGDRREPTR